MDPSAEPTAISLYDDGEWAYNAILQEGTSWLWNPRSQGVTALDNVSHAKNDHGAIPSLPRAPKGFRKEDRSLENTMKDIYRLIIHKSDTKCLTSVNLSLTMLQPSNAP